jgi:transglutaminase-like putative cysteine protease
MESRKGSVYDLCAACVATLRAAGIPARPVLGMIEAPQGTITGGMPQFRLG